MSVDLECSICFQLLTEPSELTPPSPKRTRLSQRLSAPSVDVCITACGHMFHKTCIVNWIKKSSSCPSCRKRVAEKELGPVFLTRVSTDRGDDCKNCTKKDVELAKLRKENEALESEVERVRARGEEKVNYLRKELFDHSKKLSSANGELIKEAKSLKSQVKKLSRENAKLLKENAENKVQKASQGSSGSKKGALKDKELELEVVKARPQKANSQSTRKKEENVAKKRATGQGKDESKSKRQEGSNKSSSQTSRRATTRSQSSSSNMTIILSSDSESEY